MYRLEAGMFLIGEVLTFILPFLLIRPLRGAGKVNVVRPSYGHAYSGLLCLFQSILYLALAPLDRVELSNWYQVSGWLALLAIFLIPGLGLTAYALRKRTIITDNGLQCHYLFRSEQFLDWTEIQGIQLIWRNAIKIRANQNKGITLSLSDENLELLLEAAVRHGVDIPWFKSE